MKYRADVPDAVKPLIRVARRLIQNSSGPGSQEVADSDRLVCGADWDMLKLCIEMLTGSTIKRRGERDDGAPKRRYTRRVARGTHA